MAAADRASLVVPMVCQLFHRPPPVPRTQGDGRVLWQCSCGACWYE